MFGQGKPLRPVHFGDEPGYADAFVRGGTGPLNSPRRASTVSPDEAPRVLASHLRQLRACRIALDSLTARMAVVTHAMTRTASSPSGQDPPPSSRTSRPSKLPPGPGKNPLRPSGLKKPGQVAASATARQSHPAGMSPEDARRAEAIASAVKENPELHRRLTIAVQQFQNACQTVRQAEEQLEDLADVPAPELAECLGSFNIGKVQGTLVPLVNLSEAFRDVPALRDVFARS